MFLPGGGELIPGNRIRSVLSSQVRTDSSTSNGRSHLTRVRRVGVVKWEAGDGIAEVIHYELTRLGFEAAYFRAGSDIPSNVDVIFSFAPYGTFWQLARQVAAVRNAQRPILVHWNTEGLPDLRLPWRLMSIIGQWRSWVGRLEPSGMDQLPSWLRTAWDTWSRTRMLRFRYLGDYQYTHQAGWMQVLADSSAVYCNLHAHHKLPAVYAPWGATPLWYDDLELERDIDVLWIGKRGTRRRSNLLDCVCSELLRYGVRLHIADGVENPFVYGSERTEIFNRAKITLNLTRTWYDDNFSRFSMAASNRSLIVTEPLLPHCTEYEPGYHFVQAPRSELVPSILYYLENETQRSQIIGNAYKLVTTELTLSNSIQRILEAID